MLRLIQMRWWQIVSFFYTLVVARQSAATAAAAAVAVDAVVSAASSAAAAGDAVTTAVAQHSTTAVSTSIANTTAAMTIFDRRPPCTSDIYCHGPLLHQLQMARLFPDSKTFVDMPMRQSVAQTHALYDAFVAEHPNATAAQLTEFLHGAFLPAGGEFEPWMPPDWTDAPAILARIADPLYRAWAANLNALWPQLGRRMKETVRTSGEQTSLVWVPNPVVVPGGRFREFYYWDSYWIVAGLLHSEMHRTVRGMLSNFAYIVDQYGHIPNGGRVYYMRRSQPPLFLPMVELYLQATRDTDFLSEKIATLEREFEYWMEERTRTVVTATGKAYRVAMYGEEGGRGPRPESYAEDVNTAAWAPTEHDRNEFYAELKAAAESGWDFSSRWYIGGGDNASLKNTRTRAIVPVDLNAMVQWNARLLATWHRRLHNEARAQIYDRHADDWQRVLDELLWNEERGTWFDYDTLSGRARDKFYPSNLAPLWTGSFARAHAERYARRTMDYLRAEEAVYEGGVPSSQVQTGEQWDYPNAWPPLQHMVIVGLAETGDPQAQALALQIAAGWLKSNYKAFDETKGAMFEKYDATVIGGHGGGGEYEVQLGFGWTNGVVLDLLSRFSDRLDGDGNAVVGDGAGTQDNEIEAAAVISSETVEEVTDGSNSSWTPPTVAPSETATQGAAVSDEAAGSGQRTNVASAALLTTLLSALFF